ncbi:MAG: hypothetical protein AB1405_17555 [Bdellovibrionota bacterium]
MPAKPKSAVTHRAARDLSKRVYVYRLDAEGRWSYGRNPMDDPALARQFFADIQKSAQGSYFVDCEGERCQVRVEDAPSFVDEIEIERGRAGLKAVKLLLASGKKERLDPSTLETGRAGALYCTDSRGLRARFRRKPHLELAALVEERGGRYFLKVGGKEYEVREPKT